MYNQAVQPRYFYSVNSTVMCFFLSSVLLLVSCGHKPPAEHYGFITRLGHDTIAVESVTRQGNTLTSDEVDRFPRERVRHTVIQLNTTAVSGILDGHSHSQRAGKSE
jgi:hypothetical protein